MTVHLWYVNKGQNELDATNSDLLLISYSSTCFQRLCTHHQEVGLRITAYGFCPVVAVVMLESRVARCMHCAEGFASQHPLLWCWRVGWPDACTVQRVLPVSTLCCDAGESGGQMRALCRGCCQAIPSAQCTYLATRLSSITMATTAQKPVLRSLTSRWWAQRRPKHVEE